MMSWMMEPRAILTEENTRRASVRENFVGRVYNNLGHDGRLPCHRALERQLSQLPLQLSNEFTVPGALRGLCCRDGF